MTARFFEGCCWVPMFKISWLDSTRTQRTQEDKHDKIDEHHWRSDPWSWTWKPFERFEWRLTKTIWLVVSNIVYFHLYWGKWSNLTNIVQLGWNHQLVIDIQKIINHLWKEIHTFQFPSFLVVVKFCFFLFVCRFVSWISSISVIYNPKKLTWLAGTSPIFNRKYIDSFKVGFPAIVMFGTLGGNREAVISPHPS